MNPYHYQFHDHLIYYLVFPGMIEGFLFDDPQYRQRMPAEVLVAASLKIWMQG